MKCPDLLQGAKAVLNDRRTAVKILITNGGLEK